MKSSYPLADVRVVDLSSGIAGADCAKSLADAGADVVKVEGPDGDPFRDEAALFAVLHTSKRSATFDPRRPDDRDAPDRLVRDADIVVAGHPREIRDCGLVATSRTCDGSIPELVVVSISWFGGSGPWADRPATEFTLQAWCGSIASRGRKHEPPVATGGRIGEWVAERSAATPGSRRLHGARRSGQGAFVDVSTFEAMTIAFNQFQAVAASSTAVARSRSRSAGSSTCRRSSRPPTVGWGSRPTARRSSGPFAEMVGHPDGPTTPSSAVSTAGASTTARCASRSPCSPAAAHRRGRTHRE